MGREPLLKIQYRDPKDAFEGMLVVHSLVDGLCGGGLRVTKTVTLEEVERLAAGMTLKNYVMGLPLGGGKSAIRYDPTAIDLEDALVRFFEHVGPICKKCTAGTGYEHAGGLMRCSSKRAGLKSRHMALAEKSKFGYEGALRNTTKRCAWNMVL